MPSSSNETSTSAVKAYTCKGLRGSLRVPSDKSISHRSLMLAALAKGTSHLKHLLPSADVKATAACLEALGVTITQQQDQDAPGLWNVTVQGGQPWQEPSSILNCDNSGTTMRLMSGLLAGQNLFCVLSGDASLNQRPMARVITPLNAMGAKLSGRSENTKAPVCIAPCTSLGGKPLQGLTYTLPVASAQVKSAVLLAGLFAEGKTTVIEPAATRDHTERFLKGLGVEIMESQPLHWQLPGEQVHKLQAFERSVPADPSSVAFPMVAALLSPGSKLRFQQVGLNPTRTGLIKALQQVGANITVHNERLEQGEPVGELEVSYSELKGDLHLKAAELPALIDEVPVLMVAGLYLQGTLMVEGAEELRAKESDRLEAMRCELAKLGVTVTLQTDGFTLQGNPNQVLPEAPTQPLKSWHDHRIAMSLRVLNLVNQQRQGKLWNLETAWPLQGADIVNVSYPGFDSQFGYLQQ